MMIVSNLKSRTQNLHHKINDCIYVEYKICERQFIISKENDNYFQRKRKLFHRIFL